MAMRLFVRILRPLCIILLFDRYVRTDCGVSWMSQWYAQERMSASEHRWVTGWRVRCRHSTERHFVHL